MRRSPTFRLIVLASLLAIAGAAGCARHNPSGQASAERDRFAAMFARGYVPGRSGQLFIVPDSGYFLIKHGDQLHHFQHGTPWANDTHIPLLFYGAPFVRGGQDSARVSHQNVAPTLLAMVNAPIPPSMTGQPLREVIASAARRPAAVVLIVLDGMGRATWDHWESSLPTLARLHRDGAWFENDDLDYLPTVTAVGHATLSTGTDPRLHGIQSNSNLGGDMYHGRRMRPEALNDSTLTLTDAWERDFPEAAAIVVHGTSARATVSLAGHGACLAGGRRITVAMLDEMKQGWFSNDTCYRKVPEYLAAGTKWDRYLAHKAPADSTWELFLRTPWLPDLEADAILALIAHERIGRDTIPDLLLINMKSPDYVSHRYGPYSVEADTALQHVDRALARILAALAAATAERGFVLAVTADHGFPTAREPDEESFTVQSLADTLRSHFGLDTTVVRLYTDASSHQLYVDRDKLSAQHHTLDDLARYLETLSRVKYVYTEDDLRGVKL
jgi:hypothetical protein